MSNLFDTCPLCGKEAELTNIGDIDVCKECLEEYTLCDKCGGYFSTDVTAAYHLKDGSTLCEDCAIYDLNSGDLDEDDIESIEGEETEDESEDDWS